MIDSVGLSKLMILMRIGCSEEERKKEQMIRIDLMLFLDLSLVANYGSMRFGVDYAEVKKQVLRVAQSKPFELLEKLGDEIFHELWKDYPHLKKMRIKLSKVEVWRDAIPFVVLVRAGQGKKIE